MNFVYRGSAVAFGGQMTYPVVEAPSAQAATTLPPVGGYAAASVHDYVYRYGNADLVSFRAAHSQVVGSADPAGETHSTQVSVRVEGLRILGDLVTADTVVGRLTSRYPSKTEGPLPMLPDCSSFWNLRVKGHPLTPKLNPLLHDANATRPQVEKIRQKLRFDGGPARRGNPTVFSIFDEESLPRVKKIKLKGGGSTGAWKLEAASIASGWRIDIPGFGKLYLGEYLVYDDHRVLIMIRMELGSPARGELLLAAVEGNGRPH